VEREPSLSCWSTPVAPTGYIRWMQSVALINLLQFQQRRRVPGILQICRRSAKNVFIVTQPQRSWSWLAEASGGRVEWRYVVAEANFCSIPAIFCNNCSHFIFNKYSVQVRNPSAVYESSNNHFSVYLIIGRKHDRHTANETLAIRARRRVHFSPKGKYAPMLISCSESADIENGSST